MPSSPTKTQASPGPGKPDGVAASKSDSPERKRIRLLDDTGDDDDILLGASGGLSSSVQFPLDLFSGSGGGGGTNGDEKSSGKFGNENSKSNSSFSSSSSSSDANNPADSNFPNDDIDDMIEVVEDEIGEDCFVEDGDEYYDINEFEGDSFPFGGGEFGDDGFPPDGFPRDGFPAGDGFAPDGFPPEGLDFESADGFPPDGIFDNDDCLDLPPDGIFDNEQFPMFGIPEEGEEMDDIDGGGNEKLEVGGGKFDAESDNESDDADSDSSENEADDADNVDNAGPSGSAMEVEGDNVNGSAMEVENGNAMESNSSQNKPNPTGNNPNPSIPTTAALQEGIFDAHITPSADFIGTAWEEATMDRAEKAFLAQYCESKEEQKAERKEADKKRRRERAKAKYAQERKAREAAKLGIRIGECGEDGVGSGGAEAQNKDGSEAPESTKTGKTFINLRTQSRVFMTEGTLQRINELLLKLKIFRFMEGDSEKKLEKQQSIGQGHSGSSNGGLKALNSGFMDFSSNAGNSTSASSAEPDADSNMIGSVSSPVGKSSELLNNFQPNFMSNVQPDVGESRLWSAGGAAGFSGGSHSGILKTSSRDLTPFLLRQKTNTLFKKAVLEKTGHDDLRSIVQQLAEEVQKLSEGGEDGEKDDDMKASESDANVGGKNEKDVSDKNNDDTDNATSYRFQRAQYEQKVKAFRSKKKLLQQKEAAVEDIHSRKLQEMLQAKSRQREDEKKQVEVERALLLEKVAGTKAERQAEKATRKVEAVKKELLFWAEMGEWLKGVAGEVVGGSGNGKDDGTNDNGFDGNDKFNIANSKTSKTNPLKTRLKNIKAKLSVAELEESQWELIAAGLEKLANAGSNANAFNTLISSASGATANNATTQPPSTPDQQAIDMLFGCLLMEQIRVEEKLEKELQSAGLKKSLQDSWKSSQVSEGLEEVLAKAEEKDEEEDGRMKDEEEEIGEQNEEEEKAGEEAHGNEASQKEKENAQSDEQTVADLEKEISEICREVEEEEAALQKERAVVKELEDCIREGQEVRKTIVQFWKSKREEEQEDEEKWRNGDPGFNQGMVEVEFGESGGRNRKDRVLF